MSSPLLLLPLLILLPTPGPLDQAKTAAREGRLFVDGGALPIVEDALRASPSAELTKYKEALEALQQGDETFRSVYAVARSQGTTGLLQTLKNEETLKNEPELLAHVYRLEHWQRELENLRSKASSALNGGELERARLLYEQVAAHPLVNPSLPLDLKAEIDFATKAVEAARTAHTTGVAAVWLRGLAEARAAAAAGRLSASVDKDGNKVDGAAELLQRAIEATSSRGQDEPARELLGRYQDAIDEVRRQERLIRLAYGAHQQISDLVAALRNTPMLKDYPELSSYAYLLAKWGSDYDGLRASLKSAKEARDFEKAEKLCAQMAPLARDVPALVAELESLRVELEKAREDSNLWNEQALPFLEGVWSPLKEPVKQGGGTALTLVAFILLVLLLRFPLRFIQRATLKRREDSDLQLYDLSDGVEPGPSDAQAARLKAIFREISLRPQALYTGHEVGIGEALPQWDLSSYLDLTGFSRHLSDEHAVKIGPVSISVKEIWNWLVQLVFKKRYLLTGVILTESGNIRVSLGRFDNSTGEQVGRWGAFSQGITSTSLNDAFRQVALKLAHQQLDKDKQLTDSADAFAAYYQALLLMGGVVPAADWKQALEKARDLLQNALALDPQMAHAKLKLAIVMRKLREPEVSRALLSEIPPGVLSNECKYHLALLEARVWRLRELQNARKTFEELVQLGGRLSLEAKACLLDVCVRLLMGHVTRKQLLEGEAATLEQRIHELEDFFEKTLSVEGVTPLEFAQVRGYALYVTGKRHLMRAEMQEFAPERRRQERRKGVEIIQRALVYVPELLSAHVALARAYRQSHWPRWEEYAERALGRAVQINKDDPVVNEEYGHFLAEREPPQYQKAAEYFERAADLRPVARFQWGKLLARKLGEPVKGFERMWEGIRMFDNAVLPPYIEELIDCMILEMGERRAQALKDAANQFQSADAQPPKPSTDPAENLLKQAREAQDLLVQQYGELVAASQTRPDTVLEKIIQDYGRSCQDVAARLQQAASWQASA